MHKYYMYFLFIFEHIKFISIFINLLKSFFYQKYTCNICSLSHRKIYIYTLLIMFRNYYSLINYIMHINTLATIDVTLHFTFTKELFAFNNYRNLIT